MHTHGISDATAAKTNERTPMAGMLIVGISEMARFLGMTPAGLLRRGELPEPDFISHGDKKIWLPATIEAWNADYTTRPEFGEWGRRLRQKKQADETPTEQQ